MELNPNQDVFRNATGCCGGSAYLGFNKGEASEESIYSEKENATVVADSNGKNIFTSQMIKGIPNWILLGAGAFIIFKYVLKK